MLCPRIILEFYDIKSVNRKKSLCRFLCRPTSPRKDHWTGMLFNAAVAELQPVYSALFLLFWSCFRSFTKCNLGTCWPSYSGVDQCPRATYLTEKRADLLYWVYPSLHGCRSALGIGVSPLNALIALYDYCWNNSWLGLTYGGLYFL